MAPLRSGVQVLGVTETVANIGRLRRNLREEHQQVTKEMSALLFHVTTGIVPYLTGALYGSAYNTNLTSNPNRPVWAVGYDDSIEYAWQVHETPNRIHPTRGPRKEEKQDHFLSNPRNYMAEIFPKVLRERLEAKIGRMRSLSTRQRTAAIGAVRRGV